MQRALQDPLLETEKERHCVAEEERGRWRESQDPFLKQTWHDAFKARCDGDLGPQLPVVLVGAPALNLFAGPGCAASPRAGSKYP